MHLNKYFLDVFLFVIHIIFTFPFVMGVALTARVVSNHQSYEDVATVEWLKKKNNINNIWYGRTHIVHIVGGGNSHSVCVSAQYRNHRAISISTFK